MRKKKKDVKIQPQAQAVEIERRMKSDTICHYVHETVTISLFCIGFWVAASIFIWRFPW